MIQTLKKMSKIVDELVCFFFSAGSHDVKMDLKRVEDGFELTLRSDFDPAEKKRIDDLDRFLNVTEKNEGLEEFFWQLAGVNAGGDDSEIHLVGQMVDCRKLEIRDSEVEMVLYKKIG